MSKHNPKSSRETRIQWLIDHPSVWVGRDRDSVESMMQVARLMQNAGLYSAKTCRRDIAMRLGELFDEAGKESPQKD